MSDPNERLDISDALPVQEGAPPRKRRCPACGGEDLLKLSCNGDRGLGYHMYGDSPVKRDLIERYNQWQVKFDLIDLETGKRLGYDILQPNLGVCLSCGFMAWYVARDEREWLREIRDRVREDMA
jgi:hypothetical protein